MRCERLVDSQSRTHGREPQIGMLLRQGAEHIIGRGRVADLNDHASRPGRRRRRAEDENFNRHTGVYDATRGCRMGFRGQNFAFDSPAEAVAGLIGRLRSGSPTRDLERLPLELARGRILGQPVLADRDSPAQDYAAMDGYAVRLADCTTAFASTASSIRLAVNAECRIGQAPPVMPKPPGAIRIVTGAGIPAGANLVIRREDVVEHSRDGDPSAVDGVSIPTDALNSLREGGNIRRRGENVTRDQEVLARGTHLSSSALGTLAAVGCTHPGVYPRLRVALITTGDELVTPEAAPSPYQVRNSNATALSAMLQSHAWIDLAHCEHLGDDGQLDLAIRAATRRSEAIVLTGGVSMGHRDRVREAIERAGAEVVFHGLPQRPGKPMLGAVASPPGAGPAIPILGLPGNPISAMVTCLRVAMPVLATLAGAAHRPSPPRVALAGCGTDAIDLWWHRLVRLNDAGEAVVIDGRGSGDIFAAGQSHGFIEVAPRSHPAHGEPTHRHYPFYAWPV